jgi:Tol biopolymer transport system component/DNA-binding winged helix-turn-helix (wHTH) protein
MTDRPSASIIRFDHLELDLSTGELRKEGRRIKLQEQPFRVLSLLVNRPGALVTREELRQSLWPADTFVDFDHGLNSAIARLREALGDSADKPRYIETVSKRGYRFVAPLIEPLPRPPLRNADPLPQDFRPTETHKTRKALIAALLCLALVGAVGAWTRYRGNPDAPLARIEVVPVGPLRGFQASPAFSPDGTLVAFRQSGGANDTGLYAAVVGGDRTLQLTNDRGDCCPTWSPDGRQIAFTRYSGKSLSIYIVPALGGTEHRVYNGLASMGGGVTWSADGRSLGFTESTASDPPGATVSLLSLADSSVRPITSPPPAWLDHEPAFSPDGSQIAFVRSTVAGVSNDVYVMPTSGGQPRRLTFDNRPIMGPPTWTPDSHEIVFSSSRGGLTGLWRVSAGGGIPRPVAGPVGEAMWPSIPVKGGALVYEQALSKLNIWRLNLRSPKQLERSPSAIISEKGGKMRPELSPDKKKIAFESNRLGFWDIWTCNTDSSDCQQVTSLHGTAGRARWSPDGHYLAFEFHPSERGEIYIVEVPGGTPRLMPTIPGADNLSPSWSRDGKWLYFASKRGNEPFQVWKIPSQGGSPIQLTKNGGISPVESPDGRFLYFIKYEQGGLWRLPLRGGQETEILGEISGGEWPNWAITPSGIYFLRFAKAHHGAIDYLDFDTHKILPIWTLENEPGWGLSISRDGKSIVYIQDEYAESNIMLVTNFR